MKNIYSKKCEEEEKWNTSLRESVRDLYIGRNIPLKTFGSWLRSKEGNKNKLWKTADGFVAYGECWPRCTKIHLGHDRQISLGINLCNGPGLFLQTKSHLVADAWKLGNYLPRPKRCWHQQTTFLENSNSLKAIFPRFRSSTSKILMGLFSSKPLYCNYPAKWELLLQPVFWFQMPSMIIAGKSHPLCFSHKATDSILQKLHWSDTARYLMCQVNNCE